MRKLNPKVALANSYMEHFNKVNDRGQTLWTFTSNGCCHMTLKESQERAKRLKKEATRLYAAAIKE